jgi:DNA-binding transcriptional MerR regulator
MARKYFRITEVIDICGVGGEFIEYLERERIIEPVTRRNLKLYSLDQVDRVRVAHLLINEMGVNLEGAEASICASR